MIGRMKDLEKPARVSRSPAAKHRQVKISIPEDRPPRHSAAQLRKHLGWYVALNSKPLDQKIPQIPQTRWKCPPKVALSTGWLVAVSEGSQEAVAQKCRETTVAEVVYPHLSAIPPNPSPFTSLNMGGEYGDDSQIPIIPIIPIEEVEAEMPINTSAPAVNPCNNSQTQTFPETQSVSGNLTLPHCNPSGSQDQPVKDKSLPDILRGLQSGDMEVAVAAAATVAAIMESKERIDTELLIKFLTDPEMIKKLIDERAKPEHGSTSPAPLPNTSIPLPGITPAPVTDKLAFECSRQGPQPVNQSLPVPCAKVEGAINRSVIHTSKPAKILSPLPGSNSDVPPFKNLTIEPRGPAPSHIHHSAGVKPVRPLIPSTMRPDEEMIKRLINKYGTPDIVGVVPVASPNPSTSKPNMEAMKKLINEYGSPDAAAIRPVSPLVPSIPRPNVEENKKRISIYGVPDHGLHKPFLGPNAFLSPPNPFMAMPPRPNLQTLPNALESNFTATGTFKFPSLSPATIPPPQVDLNYHKAPIEEQVEKHETWGQNVPKFGQPGNYMQGLKLAHNTTSIEMDPKYQKPCIYFSSSQGCRNGYHCPYQHDASRQWRTSSGMVEVPKRVKFS